jgi:hypothetical protein
MTLPAKDTTQHHSNAPSPGVVVLHRSASFGATSPKKTPNSLEPTESELQRQIIRLFVCVGFLVYSTSQGFRKEAGGTRTSAGIPDLILFKHSIKFHGYFEVKTEAGLREYRRLLQMDEAKVPASARRSYRRYQCQETFRQLCLATGVPHRIGGLEEARALLVTLGLAEDGPTGFTLTPMRGAR